MDENTNQNEDSNKGLLNKKQSELTVGDSLKVTIIAAAVTAAVPVVIFAAKDVAKSIRIKRMFRKGMKDLEKDKELIEMTAHEA